ncbi:MAG: hypothetical protein IKO57_12500 [Treponema sp.]|nr:hypothetical protein [Treponema sp.]
MEILENICEYYDELFPIADGQKDFFRKASVLYNKPVKFLSVNCGTGLFEHQLATQGANVTAIENEQELLESANRRRRTQVMMLNFFKMNTLEMGRFLGKGFFNIASILNGRLIFISDDILLEKFFFDIKQLLSDDGMLVLSVPNFEKFKTPNFTLPKRQSIRSSLTTKVSRNSNDEPILYQNLETGNGRIVHVTEAKINLLTRDKISEVAKKSGFSEIMFFSDFKESDFSENSDNLVAVIS